MGNKALIIIDVQYGQIEGQPAPAAPTPCWPISTAPSRWRAANTCR